MNKETANTYEWKSATPQDVRLGGITVSTTSLGNLTASWNHRQLRQALDALKQ